MYLICHLSVYFIFLYTRRLLKNSHILTPFKPLPVLDLRAGILPVLTVFKSPYKSGFFVYMISVFSHILFHTCLTPFQNYFFVHWNENVAIPVSLILSVYLDNSVIQSYYYLKHSLAVMSDGYFFLIRNPYGKSHKKVK